MICAYCGERQSNGHYTNCAEAPEFVRFQDMADKRAESGGRLAINTPGSYSKDDSRLHIHGGTRNHIDRGEPEPECPYCK